MIFLLFQMLVLIFDDNSFNAISMLYVLLIMIDNEECSFADYIIIRLILLVIIRLIYKRYIECR